jgi:NDP-sugar pyrophosphorylase family protein
MNDLESQEATAQELVAFAEQRGIDLSSTCHDFAFFNKSRFILLWRKEGKVHYNMQGPIKVLPERYKASASAFRGMWHEAGTLADLEQAFELLKAWLIDMKGVEELPERSMRREGIG